MSSRMSLPSNQWVKICIIWFHIYPPRDPATQIPPTTPTIILVANPMRIWFFWWSLTKPSMSVVAHMLFSYSCMLSYIVHLLMVIRMLLLVRRRRTSGRADKYDDVIKWKHFPRYWPFVRGIHRPPVNSPRKGQWRGALIFLWSAPE